MATRNAGMMARRTLLTTAKAPAVLAPMVPALAVNPLSKAPITSTAFSRGGAIRFKSTDDKPEGHWRPNVGGQRFSQFNLEGGVFVVTGGARGLGLCMAEALVEAGGKVHCLDRLPQPSDSFRVAQSRVVPEWGGSLDYHQVDVSNQKELNELIASIASEHKRMNGLIAAAGIQQCTSALEYTAEDIHKMLATNYTGVFLSAQACARQMYKYKTQGSICLIASMSGLIANKGFIAPVYNSSKAAVIQLTRNLAMEWGRTRPDGSGGIRVNSLSPGHILTPMVQANFDAKEADEREWAEGNMLGRISKPEEYKAAGLFLLSNASSYMTGQNLVIDGGTTAWAGATKWVETEGTEQQSGRRGVKETLTYEREAFYEPEQASAGAGG